MNRINRLVVRHARLTIATFVIVTVAFAAGVPRLHINTDVEALLPSRNPEVVYKEWAHETFGINDTALILVINDGPDGVFTPATLGLVSYLSGKLAEHPAVDGDDLVSLADIDNILADGDFLKVEPFLEDVPRTEAEARAIRDAVFENPMMVGTLISKDGRATILAAEIADGTDKVALYADFRAIVAGAPITSEDVRIAGRTVIEGEMGQIARADIARMFPIVLCVVSVVLWLSLRCLRGVLLPLLVVVSSVIWTLGLTRTGATFYAFSNIMPIILIPIGIADGIHVIDQYLRRLATDPDAETSAVVVETMDEMFQPVAMTSVTTAIGFGSLAVSSLGSVRNLGIFTAYGVLAAMVFSVTLLPAVLALLPRPRRTVEGTGRLDGDEQALGRLARLAPLLTRYPTAAIAVPLAVVLLTATGLPRLVVDGSLLQNFPRDNEIRRADALLVERLGGSVPLEIVLDAKADDGWKDPERLRAVERFQNALEAKALVGETRSIADFIKRMNAVMNPEDPDGYRIPDDRELIAQYLLLYSMSGEPDDFEDVVDYDYRLANIRTNIGTDHSPVVDALLADIDALGARELGPLDVSWHASGFARIGNTFVRLIVESQILSLLIALVLVVAVTTAMFSSLVGGLLTAMPVAAATILNFGVLAWCGIPLGVTTALCSSIAIGIGVDYAIHFVVRYRRYTISGVEPAAAMERTLGTAGTSILYNALVVIAGFLVFHFSDFLPNRTLGYLVSLNMFVCFVTTITALGGILFLLRPRFVRPRTQDAETEPHIATAA